MMGSIRQTTLILGEGITEFFFLHSLKDDYSELKSVKPDYPKNTNLEELEIEIQKAIRDFNRVFCIIDMDNKQDGKERQKYLELKKKYHNKHFEEEKKGIDCLVRFFETDRCTELFFLYYFSYTTKKFQSYDALEKELNTHCKYEKTIKFCKAHPLHPYFKKKGGSLDTAIKNAKKSRKYKNETNSDISFSELGDMFDELINK
jgi:hypothetical protein